MPQQYQGDRLQPSSRLPTESRPGASDEYILGDRNLGRLPKPEAEDGEKGDLSPRWLDENRKVVIASPMGVETYHLSDFDFENKAIKAVETYDEDLPEGHKPSGLFADHGDLWGAKQGYEVDTVIPLNGEAGLLSDDDAILYREEYEVEPLPGTEIYTTTGTTQLIRPHEPSMVGISGLQGGPNRGLLYNDNLDSRPGTQPRLGTQVPRIPGLPEPEIGERAYPTGASALPASVPGIPGLLEASKATGCDIAVRSPGNWWEQEESAIKAHSLANLF